MLKKDVVAYFGNLNRAQKAIGLRSSGSAYLWGDRVPERSAIRFDRITKGALHYSPADYVQLPNDPAHPHRVEKQRGGCARCHGSGLWRRSPYQSRCRCR